MSKCIFKNMTLSDLKTGMYVVTSAEVFFVLVIKDTILFLNPENSIDAKSQYNEDFSLKEKEDSLEILKIIFPEKTPESFVQIFDMIETLESELWNTI